MEAIGIISLGKYIFLIICAFDTILLPALETPTEKTFQRSSPEKTNTGYGIPSEGTLSAVPKKREKIRTVNSGCISTHKIPKVVCLYLTFTSRQVKK